MGAMVGHHKGVTVGCHTVDTVEHDTVGNQTDDMLGPDTVGHNMDDKVGTTRVTRWGTTRVTRWDIVTRWLEHLPCHSMARQASLSHDCIENLSKSFTDNS